MFLDGRVKLYLNTVFCDETSYVEVVATVNGFNHTQFSKPIGGFTTPNFGAIISAAAGRQTQLC